MGVRDSKDPEAGHLALDRSMFASLVARVRAGDLRP
ncbi:DUF397 domain-containing protein [Actinomadura physcomitrii]